ncbi:Late embryogenesis abundant protein [Macleaya cordata]|uniref:Late embryogenesis abundant protein n=1 Tax=Macleaya cordata TaxID=56857 RepID=A0A200PN51_MACCD|nr:Late embryogenesis abundant protein [Macleaya cordata]
MDLISSKNGKSDNRSTGFRKKRNLCFGLIIGFIVFVLLIVILGFTVFRAKHTITTVNSIKLKGFWMSLDVPRVGVDLNVTLNLDLSVKNPNKAGFKYGNGSTLLYYRGDVVGEAEIPAGEISPGETIGMNSTLTVLADRLISKSDVYSDVISGTLPLRIRNVNIRPSYELMF